LIRTFLRGAGQTLITLGLIVMLFAAYEVWGKAFEVAAQQHDLNANLDKAWADAPTVTTTTRPSPGASAKPNPADLPSLGKGVARLYIPRLNKRWVVVEGVRPSDIRLAPGHYPDTQLPGEKGNFAVAGHRMPSVFWDLDRIRDGDAIVVETRTSWFVYTVSRIHIVAPTDSAVIAPVPDEAGVAATKAVVTLTTCNPKWDNYQRLVVHGELTRSTPKVAGSPKEIAGMRS
jgi:sortase A